MLAKSDSLRALGTLSQVELNNDFDYNFLKSIKTLEKTINQPSINALQCLQKIYKNASLKNFSSIWRYVCLSLECLLSLKDHFHKQSEEAEKLLSVAQQRTVRTLLDRVISAGLLPFLLPGVEPSLPSTTPNLLSPASDLEKYESLCLVTLALVDLYHDDTFHGILFPQFLSPVLCALCQLTMVPLKKSADTYPRLQKERIIFQQHLDELVTRLYQPMVIKELMVIEGNKKCPKWLKRGVGRLLTTQLHRPGGVLAILQAVRDAANCAAPTTNSHLESIAQVITASPDLENICPQILELMDSNDAELVRMAVLCVKALHDKNVSACDVHLLLPITRPLTCAPSSEQNLSLSLHRLHKCFATPASDFWCLPSHLLQKHIHVLFQMYCKVFQSASHIRKIVQDLVWCFMSKCDETVLSSIFHCLIYREKIAGIQIINGAEFVFGDDGGVKLISTEQSEKSLEEFGDCLMILLERQDTNGLLGNKLFMTLLECIAENKKKDTVDSLEQQLVTVKLLAVLSENAAVQKGLGENPEPIVKFLRSMIDSFLSTETKEVEIISIVLVILNDFIYSKKYCWKVFSQLVEPLSLLQTKTTNTELRVLAEEAYEGIITRGVMKPKQNASKLTNKEYKVCPNTEGFSRAISVCDEAIRDACDALLPVRGHAIIQLGKLLASSDKQAKAKKDQILCIFQENLKHEDSFLYLSTIESLAAAASEFPDTVIVSLTEQYSRSTLTPDTRLKVGEALIKVTRLLGELVPVYKAELINAFLSGTRDSDFLVRASSLSNLGELCRVLGFRVGPIVAEVLLCAHCVIRSDPSVEVRRAAVMLISLLLKGLQKDALSVLQDILLELYHSLKRIYYSDKDDVTRLHAQLALEELNAGTLAFLFPKPKLTKQIFVFGPPS